jgi:hypothetical protein
MLARVTTREVGAEGESLSLAQSSLWLTKQLESTTVNERRTITARPALKNLFERPEYGTLSWDTSNESATLRTVELYEGFLFTKPLLLLANTGHQS